jgi:hypothetical protein
MLLHSELGYAAAAVAAAAGEGWQLRAKGRRRSLCGTSSDKKHFLTTKRVAGDGMLLRTVNERAAAGGTAAVA